MKGKNIYVYSIYMPRTLYLADFTKPLNAKTLIPWSLSCNLGKPPHRGGPGVKVPMLEGIFYPVPFKARVCFCLCPRSSKRRKWPKKAINKKAEWLVWPSFLSKSKLQPLFSAQECWKFLLPQILAPILSLVCGALRNALGGAACN